MSLAGRRGAAGAVLAAAALAAAALPLRAQVIPGRRDTLRIVPGQPVQRLGPQQQALPQDTGRVRRAPGDTTADTSRTRGGIPKGPSRSLQAPDSIVEDLMHRPGYRVTRYDADSVQLLARQKEIRLSGSALVDREGTQLEADTVRYQQGQCELFAVGGPKLFDKSGNVIGEGMHYDACNHTGIIEKAATEFAEGGANWFLRGNIAVDNTMNREYLAGASITSCDLPDPHYHFAAREVKYVSKRLMVSRPAVLYVADVPILWLPFIFQDMRHGRRSGILTPAFGINDILRSGHAYHRHVSNIGYYWALSDYTDAQVKMDWYSQNFLSYEGRFRYKWLDRFMTGGINYQELHELARTTNGITSGGGNTSRRISFQHQQQFDQNTMLSANIDYASSSQIISRNAVDPVLAVATIDSRVNFSRRYPWGTLALGGSRTQSLDKPLVTMTAPTVSFTPNPIAIGSGGTVVWSPGFSVSNQLQQNLNQGQLFFTGRGTSGADTMLNDSRSTAISISSPLRVGRWNWPNSFSIVDQYSTARFLDTIVNPFDTTQVTVRSYNERYSTSVDWSTGIALPTLFQGTWNLSPSVSIVNKTSGPYLLRNQFTGGMYRSQGKRLGYSVSISPTFFGRFGGIGPIAAIRHAVSPSISWSFAPSSTVDSLYAIAANNGRRPRTFTSPATQSFSIGLSQNFEAKLRPPPRAANDTTPVNPDAPAVQGRKLRLLSIQSSGFSFDVEQAKQPGRTAWQTDAFTNTFSSDLLRGFSFSMAHDLWIGPVGTTQARFQPTLTSVAAGFQVGAGTIRALGSLLGLRQGPPPKADSARADTLQRDTTRRAGMRFDDPYQRGPLATRYSAIDRLTPGLGGGAGSFSAALTFNLQSPRTDSLVPAHIDSSNYGGPRRYLPLHYLAAHRTPQEMIAGSMTFRPTAHWNVSWQTAYNVTTGQFSDHVLRLDRDLHDWRATFTFVKSPNGNFLFSFFIQLIDQPEIKFDYDQRNLR